MTVRHAMAVIAMASALGAGCVAHAPRSFAPPTDHVPVHGLQVPSRFSTVEVTRETLDAEAKRCVPTLPLQSAGVQGVLDKFPSASVYQLGHASSAHTLLLHRTTALCLQRSSAGHPVLAAEAFLQTANPQGVPPDELDPWYRQIGQLIATKGSAKVSYAYANGNAQVVSYWVATGGDASLRYASQFHKKGHWEASGIDVTFRHPGMTSISEMKRNGEAVKPYPLSHRL